MTVLVEATSFRQALQMRLARERLSLLRALVSGDELEAQISASEVSDLLALAARNDVDVDRARVSPAGHAAGAQPLQQRPRSADPLR